MVCECGQVMVEIYTETIGNCEATHWLCECGEFEMTHEFDEGDEVE
jgi:hypothetical protein